MYMAKAKAKGPFRDSRAPSWLSGPRSDVPTELPLIGPAKYPCRVIVNETLIFTCMILLYVK
jgi:hypothetical protein